MTCPAILRAKFDIIMEANTSCFRYTEVIRSERENIRNMMPKSFVPFVYRLLIPSIVLRLAYNSFLIYFFLVALILF